MIGNQISKYNKNSRINNESRNEGIVCRETNKIQKN